MSGGTQRRPCSATLWSLCLLGGSAWTACGFDWDQYDPRVGDGGGATTSGGATTTTSTTSGDGGQAAAGGAPGGSGGSAQGGAGGLGGGGSAPLPLVDTGLIARYYIDEADSGEGPSQLEDAAANPLAMPLTYVLPGEMAFIDEGGHRGLNWPSHSADSRACVPTANTKVETAIDGSGVATIEVVARVVGTNVSWSRLSHIGYANFSDLTLRVHSLTEVRFDLNETLIGVFPIDFVQLGRIVLHLVLDTTHNNAANRARLYLDGVKINPTSMTPPPQGTTTIGDPTSSYCIGNREIGDRSIAGTIFYAALYSAALSGQEVEQNAAVLLADDDTPTAQ